MLWINIKIGLRGYVGMLTDSLPLEEALKYVRAPRTPVRDDTIVPAKQGVAQETLKGEIYQRESPEYHDALFVSLNISKSRHFLIWESISLALENAFLRGNKADPNQPVIVRVYEGLDGRVIQIIDSGEGFDYKGLIKQWKAGGKYAIGSGKGWRQLQAAQVLAGYEGSGNIINIVVLYKDLE